MVVSIWIVTNLLTIVTNYHGHSSINPTNNSKQHAVRLHANRDRRVKVPIVTLPETKTSPENGWLEDLFPIGNTPPFLGPRGGAMLVSGSVKKNQESQMVYLVASMMCIAAIQGLSSQLTVGTPWGNGIPRDWIGRHGDWDGKSGESPGSRCELTDPCFFAKEYIASLKLRAKVYT